MWCDVMFCLLCLLLVMWVPALSLSSGVLLFFFFKQKTAYEMRISDWSSDVCSSDLVLAERDARRLVDHGMAEVAARRTGVHRPRHQIGRASCRERVCQYV